MEMVCRTYRVASSKPFSDKPKKLSVDLFKRNVEFQIELLGILI